LSGFDRTPWPLFAKFEGGVLLLERGVDDSACLTILWPVEGHGLLALTTATLIERSAPYHLSLELARGTINQLRGQLFDWQMIGLAVPREVTDKLREAVQRFDWAVVSQDEPASWGKAEEAIRFALDASQILAGAYAEQVLAVRCRGATKLATLFGAELGGSPPPEAIAQPFLSTFNVAMVPMLWRDIEASEGSHSWTACDQQIEWCRSKGIKVGLGPLLRFDDRGLPDWTYLWEDDFDSLLEAASDFVRAAVMRYRGKIDFWLPASRINTSEMFSFSEEENLRFAAGALGLVRTLDPGTPRIMSIDQPWGERMGRRQVDFSPLHFADALVRAGLDLRAIMLEINLGSSRGGTLPRSEIEFSRMIDHWGVLGLPLFLSLSVPSDVSADPRARRLETAAGSWSPEAQQRWAARYLPLLLAKPAVQAVFWNQLCDAQPHDFPHAGLFDERGQAKPIMKTFCTIRTGCLR
jgi:hypothetical protein